MTNESDVRFCRIDLESSYPLPKVTVGVSRSLLEEALNTARGVLEYPRDIEDGDHVEMTLSIDDVDHRWPIRLVVDAGRERQPPTDEANLVTDPDDTPF